MFRAVLTPFGSVMVIAQKHVFVTAVCCERDERNAEAWEGPFESIDARERTCISPLLSMQSEYQHTGVVQ